MKIRWAAALAAVLILGGCAVRAEDPEDGSSPQGLELDSLAVEISKNDLPAERLVEALEVLPELLRAALADQGVEAETLTVTVGASPAATAQALAAGAVDAAFFPAEALAQQPDTPALILVSGPRDRDGTVGQVGWLCTTDTEYGRALSGRSDPTWEELSRARWGLLEETSLLGRRAAGAWLAEQCPGRTLAELPDVTVYRDFDALIQAAAAGEIDCLAVDEAVLAEWETAWTLPADQTDPEGRSGLGRTKSIWEELPVLGETGRYYTMAAAVAPDRPELAEETFAAALAAAVESLCAGGEGALCRDVFGTEAYAAAPEDALAAARQVWQLEQD